MSKLSDFLGGAGGAGFGSLPVQVVSVDSTVDSNTSIGINTKDRVVTVTMPASPEIGDMLVFFDAAMTWNVRRAVINTNGNKVHYQTGNLTSFDLREKAGILSLLFVDSETGWVDTSYYETATDPVWFGAKVEKENELLVLTGNHTLLRTFTSSGDYRIPSTGLYVFRMAGGGSNTLNAGGESRVRAGNDLDAGTGAAARRSDREKVYRNPIIYFRKETYSSSADIAQGVFTAVAHPINKALYDFQAEALPLATFNVEPGSRTYHANTNWGYGTTSTSFSAFLTENTNVTLTVGAGAAGGEDGGVTVTSGGNGKIEIYRIT